MGEGEFIWERPEGKLNPGASVLGKEEIEEVLAVIKGRALSRDYGPDSRETVLNFERNIVEKLGAGFALGVTTGTAALRCRTGSRGNHALLYVHFFGLFDDFPWRGAGICRDR